MNPLSISLLLAAGLFFQVQEDPEVAQGIAFFEKGDFKNAQRYLTNSLPRARDVAQASWCLSLVNIAISNKSSGKERDELLAVASGLLENLAGSSSSYGVSAAIGYNDCLIKTSRIRSLPQLLKANELLNKALKNPEISSVDLMNIKIRINYNAFLIAQYGNSEDELGQGRPEGGDKKQKDNSSQPKSADDKNKGDVSDKEPDKSKGEKTDKKAGVFTDKVQAGRGNVDLVPYGGRLQDISREEAGKLVREAAKKVKQANGENPP